MLIENQYKNEINYLKIELTRKDIDYKPKKFEDYTPKNPTLYNLNNNNNSILQQLENEKDLFSQSEKKKKEKPEKELKEIKNEIEKFEKKIVRDNDRFNTFRTNEDVGDSKMFIDKFKRVIDKLENRLEKMSSDIKIKPNNSYELFDK